MRRSIVASLVVGAATLAPMEVWLDGRGGAPLRKHDVVDRYVVDAGGAVEGVEAEAILAAEDAGDDGVARLRTGGGGALAGGSVRVRAREDARAAAALVGSVDWCLADATGAQPCIIAENLLSVAEGTGTRIACTVQSAADVAGLAFALERGVDAVVLRAGCDASVLEAAAIAKAQRSEAVDATADAAHAAERDAAARVAADLRVWRVAAIEEGGVADRVAVDFTTLLAEDEGLLVGSSAKALCLVLGETATGGFVPPRPFRVNAGPVHGYCLAADGTTPYLSEVTAGRRLVVARAGGGTREAVVGRAKVEPRPILRVDVEAPDGAKKGQICLQQAETVRLAGPSPLPVTRAKPGDTVLVRADDRGTHVGRRISVRVEEK